MQPLEPTDEDLIRRFYQADEGALTMIFQRHKLGLFNFALRLCSNRADAEDAVSHVFMMVCEKRYTQKPGASFKTWAYTVTHHQCISKLRSKSKYFSLWPTSKNEEENMPLPIADGQPLVREQLDQKQITALVQKAISRLSHEQKEALLLKEYHGFSYEEISQVLNCSLDKVKVLIFRARTRLKELLPPVVLEEGR